MKKSEKNGRPEMTYPLLRFSGAVLSDPAIGNWFSERPGELGSIARKWFFKMRTLGEDVLELMHDGFPTVLVENAPFGHVNIARAHVTVAFFHGASLPDPGRILEGNGKYMRHVKLKPTDSVPSFQLEELVENAYLDIKKRLKA